VHPPCARRRPVPDRPGGRPEGGAIMSQAAVPQSVTIPAVPKQVRAARAFVAGALGKSHAHAEVALLLASELVTNSVAHSGSAVAGGAVGLPARRRARDDLVRACPELSPDGPGVDLRWTPDVPRVDLG